MERIKECRIDNEHRTTAEPLTFLSGKQKRKLKRAFERKLEKMSK